MSEPSAPQDPPPPQQPLDYATPPGRVPGIHFAWQVAIAVGVTVFALAATITPYLAFPSSSNTPAFLLIFPGITITALTLAAIRGGARSVAAGLLGLALTFGGLIMLALGICFTSMRP